MKHSPPSPLFFYCVKCHPLVAVTPIYLHGHSEKNSVYGFSAYIDSNRGRKFESQLLNELLQFAMKIDLQCDP